MNVATVGPAGPDAKLGHRLASARARTASIRARTEELQQQTRQLLAETQDVRRTVADARRERRFSPAGRELLQRSEHLRLLARLETMPVVEQAKGIIMAKANCGETEAFDMLRRVSQRSNVPVRILAAQIVAKAAETAAPAVAGPDMLRRTTRHANSALLRAG